MNRRVGGSFMGIGIALAIALSMPVPSPHAQAAGDALGAISRRFLNAIRGGTADDIRRYFPRTGDLTYRHTRHGHDGDHLEVWRFTGEDAGRQLDAEGPLFEAVQPSPEGQTIGVFVYQVQCRGITWKRVHETRFVPPGADASSPVFVEWRRESRRWVISAIGDESFANDSIPEWDC